MLLKPTYIQLGTFNFEVRIYVEQTKSEIHNAAIKFQVRDEEHCYIMQ